MIGGQPDHGCHRGQKVHLQKSCQKILPLFSLFYPPPLSSTPPNCFCILYSSSELPPSCTVLYFFLNPLLPQCLRTLASHLVSYPLLFFSLFASSRWELPDCLGFGGRPGPARTNERTAHGFGDVALVFLWTGVSHRACRHCLIGVRKHHLPSNIVRIICCLSDCDFTLRTTIRGDFRGC